MKKLFGFAIALYSALSFGFTTVPVATLDPTGSTAGSVVASTGATSAPAWSTLTGVGAMPIAGGTFTGDVGMRYATNTTQRSLIWTNQGVSRWSIQNDGVNETGSNIGSNFRICRYVDAGTVIDCPLLIARNTGAMTFTTRPTWAGLTPYDSGNLTIANYLTTATAATTYQTNSGSLSAGTVQSVTGSRTLGGTYTNSTGRPIFVNVTITTNTASATTLQAVVGGVTVGLSPTVAQNTYATSISFLVPNGAVYGVSLFSGGGTLYAWVEVR